MNRGRKVLFAAVVSGPAIVLAVACTFPEVTFNDGDGAVGTTTSSSSSSSSSGGPGPNDGAPDEDAAGLSEGGLDPDAKATSRPDGSVIIEGGIGCDARCDCDDDGWLRIGCDAAAPGDTAAVIGLEDCNDFDDQVHPMQDQFFEDKPTPPNVGDWNCSGLPVEKGYTETKCPGIVAGCSGETFGKAVGCGEQSAWYSCTVDTILGCKAVLVLPSKTQACR